MAWILISTTFCVDLVIEFLETARQQKNDVRMHTQGIGRQSMSKVVFRVLAEWLVNFCRTVKINAQICPDLETYGELEL